MADIRINSLPSTATSFNTDDYIAIDGASAGTRRMLAANPPFSDVILGTSGPSVKSTLSARAPRQGLVFDGTNYCQISPSVPAAGTSNFTVTAVINTDLSVDIQGIIGTNTAGGFGLFSFSTGALAVQNVGVGTVGVSTGLVTANKASFVAYVRSGTTGTFYINGVSAGTITDGTNYNQVNNLVGTVAGLNLFKGSILAPTFYNRALSASEVVALYEAGAPAGADYNSASNTGIITGQNNTFNGGIGNWTSGGTGTVAAGTNVMNCTAGSTADNLAGYLTFVNAGYNPKGYYVRVTADITNNSGTVRIGVGRAVLTQIGSLAGNGTFDATAFLPATTDADSFWICGATSSQTFTVDNFQVFRLGLLLAPDAAQAGGGLVWYDTSGNAANITLPASGVSWNVPSSRVLGGNWTTSGNLTVNPGAIGGGYLNLNKDGADLYLETQRWTGVGNNFGATRITGSTSGGGFLSFSTSNEAAIGSQTLTEWMRLFSNGNLFIGASPVDAGQKLQVRGDAIFRGATTENVSVDIGAGRSGNGNAFLDLVGDATYTDYGLRMIRGDGGANSYSAIVHRGTGTFEINCVEAASIALKTSSTTALTLDSSQNATFAGSVRPEAAPSSKWAIDFASGTGSGAYVTIANDGTYDVAVGSGMLFVWDDGGSGVSQIMCYYGQTAITWQDGTFYTVTADTANKVNVYYNAGTNKYRVQNKSGSSKNFYISTIRLRQGS